MLAAVGIYGLIAYSVSQRTQEIGIRMAPGAKASDISWMILREGLRIAVMLFVAMPATIVPARKAVKVDPSTALRSE